MSVVSLFKKVTTVAAFAALAVVSDASAQSVSKTLAQTAQSIRGTQRDVRAARKEIKEARAAILAQSVNNNKAILANGAAISSLDVKLAQLAVANTPKPQTEGPAGKNVLTSSYEALEFFTGRSGQALVQHFEGGVRLTLRVMEEGKMVQEAKFEYASASRTADQKAADTLVLLGCLEHFNRAADTSNYGAFYYYVSSDPKIGVICTSAK